MNQNSLNNGFGIAKLNHPDTYAEYCMHLEKVFNLLIHCYRNDGADSGDMENDIIEGFMRKFLYTIQVLRIKYFFDENRSLEVDLTASGFPTHYEIELLNSDLASRDTRIKEVRSLDVLKVKLIDELVKRQRDPEEILWELGRRTFYEMLEHEKMFLVFTPGELQLRSVYEDYRSYVFSWGGYDFKTNCPFIHIMTFDQDIDEQPLEEHGANYEELIAVISQEGTRAPEMAVVAVHIDNAIESIHPKILKRIGIGPLYSPFVAEINPEQAATEHELANELMLDSSRRINDFMLFFNDEIVMSMQQEQRESLFRLATKTREIFFIPDRLEDEEGFNRKASHVRRNVLLPHGILQQINDRNGRGIRKFEEIHKITFDDKGVRVNG